MIERITEASPRLKARIAGGLWLMVIGGSSYVISSFTTFLSPAFGARLTPFIVPAALLGEGSLTLWLIVMGVNEQRWKEQASAAGE